MMIQHIQSRHTYGCVLMFAFVACVAYCEVICYVQNYATNEQHFNHLLGPKTLIYSMILLALLAMLQIGTFIVKEIKKRKTQSVQNDNQFTIESVSLLNAQRAVQVEQQLRDDIPLVSSLVGTFVDGPLKRTPIPKASYKFLNKMITTVTCLFVLCSIVHLLLHMLIYRGHVPHAFLVLCPLLCLLLITRSTGGIFPPLIILLLFQLSLIAIIYLTKTVFELVLFKLGGMEDALRSKDALQFFNLYQTVLDSLPINLFFLFGQYYSQKTLQKLKVSETLSNDRVLLLELLLEHIPAVLWKFDNDLNVRFSCGGALNNLFSKNVLEEIRKKNISNHYGPSNFHVCRFNSRFLLNCHNEVIQKGKSFHLVHYFNDVPFSTVLSPLYDETTGEIIGGVGSAYEINDLITTQTRLKHSEERCKSIVDSISDCLFKVNRDFVVLFANQKCYASLKPKGGNLIGENILESVFDNDTTCREMLEQLVLECWGNKNVSTPSGSSSDIEDIFNLGLDSNESEEILESQKKRNKTLEKSHDSEGEDEKITENNRKNSKTNYSGTLLDEDDFVVSSGCPISELGEYSKREELKTREWKWKNKRVNRHFTIRATPILKKEKLVSIVLLVSDVTEKMKTEEIIQQAEYERIASISKSEFIASLTHEIRNPLNAIMGTVQLLSFSANISPLQKEYIEDIHENVKLLAAIISDVLDMSKIESGRLEIIEQPHLDILELVESSVDAYSSQSVHKNVDLFSYVDVTKIPTDIIGDKTRILQILLNFVSNAVKYTEKGYIVLKAEYLSEEQDTITIKFSCTDTGIGMTEVATKKVFERFFQVKPASKVGEYLEGPAGYGLGLYICNNLARLMGTSIQIKSKLNEGSRFEFDLTLKKAKQKVPTMLASGLYPSRFPAVIVMHHNQTFTDEIMGKYLKDALHVSEVLSINFLDSHTFSKIKTFIENQREKWINNDLNYIVAIIVDEKMKHEFDTWYGDITLKNTKVIYLISRLAMIEERMSLQEYVEISQKPTLLSEGEIKDRKTINNEKIWKEDSLDYSLIRKPLKLLRLMTALSGRKISTFSKSLMEIEAPPSSKKRNESFNIHEVRMMVVEDNLVNQKILVKLLQQMGIKNVCTANNGVEALNRIQSNDEPYDMIFMDLQMPIMNGFECSKQIRNLPDQKKASVPILAVTANAWQTTLQEAKKAGMTDVVTKPFSIDTLKQKISNALFGSSSNNHHQHQHKG